MENWQRWTLPLLYSEAPGLSSFWFWRCVWRCVASWKYKLHLLSSSAGTHVCFLFHHSVVLTPKASIRISHAVKWSISSNNLIHLLAWGLGPFLVGRSDSKWRSLPCLEKCAVNSFKFLLIPFAKQITNVCMLYMPDGSVYTLLDLAPRRATPTVNRGFFDI